MHTYSDSTQIIKACEFKTHCLEIMDVVDREKKEYVITKRGIPVAKLIPITAPLANPFGYLKDTVIFMDDIISPIDITWGSDSLEKDNQLY